MKKILLLWIGLLFLLINVNLNNIIIYPPFITYPTNAPDTLDMIINHVIGSSLRIDIFSDIIGYVLIIIASYQLIASSPKFIKTIFLASLGILSYVVLQCMPFVLNGEERFQAGFVLYILYFFVKAFVTINAALTCCALCECIENRAWNSVVSIFVLLSAFSGIIYYFSFFYDFIITTYIYYALQIAFTALYSFLFWKRRHYISYFH